MHDQSCHTHSQQFSQLASDIAAAGLSRPEIEGILYRLSPAQRRLFLHLAQGPADTVTIRTQCSIGNISECARELNEKLARAGDRRRVVCDMVSHVNAYGDPGKLGQWSLASGVSEVVAA